MESARARRQTSAAGRKEIGFRVRARYVGRSLGFLSPYWGLMLGAYLAVFASNGMAIWMPRVIRRIVDEGIRAGVCARQTTAPSDRHAAAGHRPRLVKRSTDASRTPSRFATQGPTRSGVPRQSRRFTP